MSSMCSPLSELLSSEAGVSKTDFLQQIGVMRSDSECATKKTSAWIVLNLRKWSKANGYTANAPARGWPTLSK